VREIKNDHGSFDNLLYISSMRKLWILTAILILPALLGGCSSSETIQKIEPLTPLTFDNSEPDDAALADAIALYLAQGSQPRASGYDYARIDLNGDRKRDALVMLKVPYGYWCGIHGCTMLVFTADGNKFTLINAVQPVRGPVYVSTLKSNGWKNLVIRVSGRSSKAKDVAMMFDGRRYPITPSNLPPFPKKNYNGYTRVLMGDYADR